MKWRFSRRIPMRATVVALLITMLAVSVALALTMSNADGRWSNVVSNASGGTGVGCLYYGNGSTFNTSPTAQDGSTTDENQARWGGISSSSDCTPHPSQSGFGFDGTNGPLTFNPGQTFLLGKFTHFNNPVYFGSANDTPVSMDLAVALNFSDPPATNVTFNYNVLFDETQNNLNPCPYGGNANGCYDRVTFPGSLPDQTFTIGGVDYTLQVIGFVPHNNTACPAAPSGPTSSIYTTAEQTNNYACLYAQIVTRFDFGDAPDTAGQTLLPNGARHNITANGSYLGTVRGDGDANGQPNATATGDDANALDDEDGFVSMDTNWGDGAGFVNVSVTRGTITGINRACVYSWIDWGNDGFGVGTDSTATGFRDTAGNGSLQLTFNANVPAQGSFPSVAYLRLRVVSSTTASCPAVGPTGLQNEGEVEDHRLSFMPLAVDLASFTAAAAPEGVTLAWQTVSEMDNAGFNVYRSESDAGPWVKLTETLIPAAAPGSAEGQAYTWTDTTAQAGLTYFYQLEDIALSGATTLHAPVSVALMGPNAIGLAGFGATAATSAPALAGLAGVALAALAGMGLRRKR